MFSSVIFYAMHKVKEIDMERNFYVYSYYNRKKQPLYIGKSEHVMGRFISHNEDWMHQVCYVGVRKYPSQTDMYIAEAYYIAKEKPLYNKQFQTDSPTVLIATNFTDIIKEEFLDIDGFYSKYKNEVYANTYQVTNPRKKDYPRVRREIFKKSALINPRIRELMKKYPRATELEMTPMGICAALMHTNQTYQVGNCFFSVEYTGYEYYKANNIVIKHLVDSWNGINAERYKDKVIFNIEYQSVKDAIWPVLNVETVDGFSEIKLAKTKCSTDGRTVRYEMLSPEAIAKKLKKMGAKYE